VNKSQLLYEKDILKKDENDQINVQKLVKMSYKPYEIDWKTETNYKNTGIINYKIAVL